MTLKAENCQDEKCTTGGGGVVGESGIWVNGRMREVEKSGPFRILERDWDLGYICRLRSFTMFSCMVLFQGSQAVQTSRFSVARVPMNTCRMWYTERFWKCSL
jgi:hypothetical protein